VIAFPLGSMPELVVDGVTGFLVEDVDSAVTAVARVEGLSRRDCRDHVELRFSAQRMVADYAGLFERIVAAGPSGGGC
jgi:glycosyltransferase involved in cell wall biosynthesis